MRRPARDCGLKIPIETFQSSVLISYFWVTALFLGRALAKNCASTPFFFFFLRPWPLVVAVYTLSTPNGASRDAALSFTMNAILRMVQGVSIPSPPEMFFIAFDTDIFLPFHQRPKTRFPTMPSFP
jgi:hypothetical protein